MAKICQISGKKGNSAQHVRHRHSAWKFRAPHKPRRQQPNLQVVTLNTPHGKVRLTIAASILKRRVDPQERDVRRRRLWPQADSQGLAPQADLQFV